MQRLLNLKQLFLLTGQGRAIGMQRLLNLKQLLTSNRAEQGDRCAMPKKAIALKFLLSKTINSATG